MPGARARVEVIAGFGCVESGQDKGGSDRAVRRAVLADLAKAAAALFSTVTLRGPKR